MENNTEYTRKQRIIAALLLMMAFLIMCMVIVGVPRELKRWVYANHVNDKITHIAFAGIFTYLASMILYPLKLRYRNINIYLGAIIVFFLITFDEVSQVFLPGRDADPLDLIAGLSGWLMGYLVFYFQTLRKTRRRNSPLPPSDSARMDPAAGMPHPDHR